MADMDNKTFKEELAKMGEKPQNTDIVSFLGKIGSLDDYDTESLDKLSGLMESLGENVPDNLKDLSKK